MCTSTATAVLELVGDGADARRARRFVDEHWCVVHGAVLRGHALLVASELVTYAAQHGRPPLRMTLDCDGEAGTTAVSDADPGGPELLAQGSEAPQLRRLQLVAVLSDEWGVTTRPGGKTIWSRLVA